MPSSTTLSWSSATNAHGLSLKLKFFCAKVTLHIRKITKMILFRKLYKAEKHPTKSLTVLRIPGKALKHVPKSHAVIL